MEKKWYIVNTQTGCEAIAKAAIEERISSSNLKEHFGEILIPSENVVQMVRGKKQVRSKKFFPGYIFVSMVLTDQTWHLIRNCSKVSGFVGAKSKPAPVSEEEVRRVATQMQEGAEKVRPKANFSIGEGIVVIDGPFSNFNGSVEEINEDKGKVKVLVSIFGRPTPVELDFAQIEKTE